MEPEPVRAWESPEVFPHKPEGQDYGYLAGGRMVGCTKEELIRRCGVDQVPAVYLVWTPETPRLAPPVEVPFLFESVKACARRRFKRWLILGLLQIVAWGMPCVALPARLGELRWLLLINAAFLGLLPFVRSVRGLARLRRYTPAAMLAEAPAARYAAWLGTKKTVYTWLMALGLLVVGILQSVTGMSESIRAAGLVKEAARHGQPWRLLTGALLHGGVLHLAFNLSALLMLGRLTEVIAHRAYLPLVFLVSLVGGSETSLYLLPHTTSVGASGGIMGLFGFLLILGLRRRRELPPRFGRSLLVSIALIAAVGILEFQAIDNAAHLGGLIAGALLGWGLIPKQGPLPLEPGQPLRSIGVASIVIIAAGAVLAIATFFRT